MALLCCICGDASLSGVRCWEDWCPDCTALNFANRELRLQGGQAPAREALEAYVSTPLTARQRSHMQRLHAHWEAEARRRGLGEEAR